MLTQHYFVIPRKFSGGLQSYGVAITVTHRVIFHPSFNHLQQHSITSCWQWKGRVWANGWTHPPSMTVSVHFFIRSAIQIVTIVTLNTRTLNIIFSVVLTALEAYIVNSGQGLTSRLAYCEPLANQYSKWLWNYYLPEVLDRILAFCEPPIRQSVLLQMCIELLLSNVGPHIEFVIAVRPCTDDYFDQRQKVLQVSITNEHWWFQAILWEMRQK